MKDRMPTAFVPHGGGPWPVLPLPMMDAAETDSLAIYMRSIAELPPTRPSALLVVSAHWEATSVTVNSGRSPGMLYDYGGFPPEAYRLTWPAPGAPELASAVYEHLASAGFRPEYDAGRGYDHGTFIPLMLAYPQADIPVVQVSLKRGLDPAEHFDLGAALAPFRDRGVYIIGSGNSYHNLTRFFSADRTAVAQSEEFDAWLADTIALDAVLRRDALRDWQRAPAARACHPREEHLIPLMVVAGAAGDDTGRVGWTGTNNGLRISAHHFG